jgi:hypothetical protein
MHACNPGAFFALDRSNLSAPNGSLLGIGRALAAIPVTAAGCAGLATVNPCRLGGLLAEDDADADTSRALPRNLVDTLASSRLASDTPSIMLFGSSRRLQVPRFLPFY